MSSSHGHLDCDKDPSSGTIASVQSAIDTYLQSISKSVPNATYQTHKKSLITFSDWHDSWDHHENTELITPIACFIGELLDDYTVSVYTISGHASTFSNFAAFCMNEDPELLTVAILSQISNTQRQRRDALSERLCAPIHATTGPSGVTRKDVKAVISYLRQSRYGTRTHVFAELILESVAKPGVIHELDISDINLTKGTLKLGLPKTYLVGSTGLVNSRKAQLEEAASASISEYIKHNRKSISGKQSQPLLSTSYGRASLSTLRRGLTRTNERLANRTQLMNGSEEQSCGEYPHPEDRTVTVSPIDVWWLAIKEYYKNL